GLVEVTELLIAKGSDIDAKDKWSGTPLAMAARWARGESGYTIVKLLIDRGAYVNSTCSFGCTILHHASGRYKPQPDVVRLLIAKGADVNAKTNTGQTPLHLSVRQGHRDTVELLLTKSADINAKNKWDRTPLDIAIDRGYTEIVELLRKHGAKE
ncbi:MAG: ankyrin repeat domain-containing protein, partial [Sedimentisphaerales bacterium]